jgi:hypothetical protein
MCPTHNLSGNPGRLHQRLGVFDRLGERFLRTIRQGLQHRQIEVKGVG